MNRASVLLTRACLAQHPHPDDARFHGLRDGKDPSQGTIDDAMTNGAHIAMRLGT